jgi:hypothetical protein
VAWRRLLAEEPLLTTMRLSAPFVPPPATQSALLPLTLKDCVEAGAQDSNCCPFTRIEVMVLPTVAVLMVISPRELTLPTDVELTVMPLPFSVVPLAMEVTMTFEPVCVAT